MILSKFAKQVLILGFIFEIVLLCIHIKIQPQTLVAFIGIGYLIILMLVLHTLNKKPAKSNNAWIRRTMVLSMVRMLLVLTFFLIALVNAKLGNANFKILNYYGFVISYIVFFVLTLVLEIIEMRTNLRPHSKT